MIQRISFEQVRLEGGDLFSEYAAECAFADIGPPHPQWDIYAALEAAGVLIVLAAYVDGVMAGFASVIVSILPHYGIKVGTVESLFVGTQYRNRGAGSCLRRAVRAAASAAGCKRLFTSAPAGSRLERILEHGSHRTNSVFCETLA